MVDTKKITDLIPAVMAAGLISDNISDIKKKKKNLLRSGIKNIVGVNLIKATAQAGA